MQETVMVALMDVAAVLAKAIDDESVTEFPATLIAQWQLVVDTLRQMGMPEEYQSHLVLCPGMW